MNQPFKKKNKAFNCVELIEQIEKKNPLIGAAISILTV